MRYRDFWLFLLGAALGGGVVFLVLTCQREVYFPHAVAEPETVRVLVARQPLSYGTAIRAEHLQWHEWPKAAVPPGAFTSAEALLGVTDDQHRFVLRRIEAGEPILESKITRFGESPRRMMNLGADRRAVSFQVDAASGVSGFVAAGDRVDVLLTRTLEGRLVTSVILQGITIIAIDYQSGTGPSSPRLGRAVTVEVDTVQAQKLALAQQVGRLSLVLRGTGAPDLVDPPRPLTPDDLDLPPGPGDSRRRMQGPITDFPIHPALEPPPDAN